MATMVENCSDNAHHRMPAFLFVIRSLGIGGTERQLQLLVEGKYSAHQRYGAPIWVEKPPSPFQGGSIDLAFVLEAEMERTVVLQIHGSLGFFYPPGSGKQSGVKAPADAEVSPQGKSRL